MPKTIRLDLPPPSLLMLPRETRDMIYTYLTQLRKFILGVRTVCGSSNNEQDVWAYFVNAPMLNVLLIHPQIYHEYLEADCFRSLLIHTMLIASENMEIGYAESPRLYESPTLAHGFQHVRIFNIHVKCETDSKRRNEGMIRNGRVWNKRDHFWDTAYEFLPKFQPLCPSISTVRILLYHKLEDKPDQHQLKYEPVARDFVRGEPLFSPPPARFLGLPLRQCVQAYRYGYSSSRAVSTAPQTNSSPDEVASQEFKHYHSVYKYGAYMFTKAEQPNHWVESSDLLLHNIPRRYPRDVLAKLPKDEAKELKRIGREMDGWKELREENVKDWGIRKKERSTRFDGI